MKLFYVFLTCVCVWTNVFAQTNTSTNLPVNVNTSVFEAISLINPLKPVVRLDFNSNIVERLMAIPESFNNTYPYRNVGSLVMYRHGWRQAEVESVLIVETNLIPPEIQHVAGQYKAKMEQLFGPGSHLNTNLSESAVTLLLLANTNVTADDGLRLKTEFEVLKKFTGKTEVWSFPYDQTEVITKRYEKVWTVVE